VIVRNVNYYRGFAICTGSITKGDSLVNPNNPINAEYNQLLYLVIGSGKANDVDLPSAGRMYDLSQLKGQPITYQGVSETSAWVAFNPLKQDKELDVEILKGESERTLLDDVNDIIVVPIDGNVSVGSTTIETLKSGRLPAGKSAVLTVPTEAVCAIVKVVDSSV